MDELCRVSVVGMDASHLGGGQDHVIDFLLTEEIPHCQLFGEVQFLMSAGDNVGSPRLAVCG